MTVYSCGDVSGRRPSLAFKLATVLQPVIGELYKMKRINVANGINTTVKNSATLYLLVCRVQSSRDNITQTQKNQQNVSFQHSSTHTLESTCLHPALLLTSSYTHAFSFWLIGDWCTQISLPLCVVISTSTKKQPRQREAGNMWAMKIKSNWVSEHKAWLSIPDITIYKSIFYINSETN